MKQVLQRVVIYPKDISRITGKSERYGCILLQNIKKHLSKDDHQYITTEEFSQYTGLPLELIAQFIKD